MALNIDTGKNYINTTTSHSNNIQVSNKGSESVSVSVKGLNLKSGQMLSGQVSSIDGKDVTLQLSNNQTIHARLEGNINTYLGQTLSFEVSNSDGNKAVLRPLYTNLTNEPAIMSALDNANLPHTDQLSQMVSQMMKEGMSVNRDALWSMAKSVQEFPLMNPETIVSLKKLGLPINEMTINQFDNYKNFEHQIRSDVENLSDGLVELMDEFIGNTETSAGDKNNLFNSFMNALAGKGDAVNSSSLNAENMAATTSNLTAEQLENINKGIDIAGQIMDLVDITNDSEAANVSDKLLNLINEFDNALNEEEMAKLSDTASDAEALDENVENNSQNINNLKNQGINEANDNAALNENSALEAREPLNLNANEALQYVKDIINQYRSGEELSDSLKEKLSKILSNNDFKDILKSSLDKQLLLKPDEVTGSKVDELYAKIVKQANSALEILNSAGKENVKIADSAQNLNNSVDFMQQLNQAVTYVQIPLLMNNETAHGDLYVYTNKKNLQSKEGNISALLHLDMDNLGPMDVYIGLKDGNKVNTHFYLQDDATIDFIANHIDRLNERLIEKGYNVSIDYTTKGKDEKPVNLAEEFMKENPEEKAIRVSKMSFDVRA